MTRLKKMALAAAVLFTAIQFVRPARNENGQVLDTDIAKTLPMPSAVQGILANACFDCHSNHTRYPFYMEIQPAGWIMASHVRNGKKQLNFSEFGSLPKRRQASKLNSIAKQIEDDAMPLRSYRWLHGSARLSQTEKEILIQWANTMEDSLAVNR